MIIQFNPEKMHIQIIVGVDEKYEPTKEIKNITKRVETLKQKMTQFMTEISPELEDIKKLVDEENKKYTLTKPEEN